jgi:hypothetical protein
MLGERQRSMHLFSTEGRASVASWATLMGRSTAGLLVMVDGAATWRRAMTDFCTGAACLRACADCVQEAKDVFRWREQGLRRADFGRPVACSEVVADAATGSVAGSAATWMVVLEMEGRGGRAGSEAGSAWQHVVELVEGAYGWENGPQLRPVHPRTPGRQVAAGWQGRGWSWGAGCQGAVSLPSIRGLHCGRREAHGGRRRARLWWFLSAAEWNARVRALHGSGDGTDTG